MRTLTIVMFYLISALLKMPAAAVPAVDADLSRTRPSGIHPSTTHPGYWMFNGVKVLLLGGSVEDNLFQIDGLEEHLDLLKSVGGNYVRNTMSSRDPGNLWPFAKNRDGLYDLNQWNEDYWQRFERFLRLTSEREIFVQIEIWATFDFYRDNWEVNPYNPKNNVNYDQRRSKLPLVVDSHPVYTENNFFRSVPSKMNIAPVLWFQKRFVDRILSTSLKFGHVLYCMDNETSVTSEWARFWARYIRRAARLAGRTVQTTEMWDPHDLGHPMHFETFDYPDIFTFVDISQNNHQSGDDHWRNGLKQIDYLKAMNLHRPVNNVKIYGNDGGRHKTTRDAVESFCRNILFGAASARFHRPTSGQGLNGIAQSVIRSVRLLSESMDFFNGRPMNDLLGGREANEAFCRAVPGGEAVVYFTEGGEVTLDTSSMARPLRLRWMAVLESEWSDPQVLAAQGQLKLKCPGPGHWFALVDDSD